MSVKVIALGNVLMKDDGIAIYLASELEKELLAMDVEVFFGETDIGYCLSEVQEGDYLILLDAALMGRKPGDIIRLSFQDYPKTKGNYTQHSISFLDLLEFYYPKAEGIILAVEIEEVEFFYGLSQCLEDKFSDIVQEIRKQIIAIKNSFMDIDKKIEIRKVPLMDEAELKRIIYDYIKEICHYSQMQVFATSTYQKNYFQLQIDETFNLLYSLFINYQGTVQDTLLYTTQQGSGQSEQLSEMQEGQEQDGMRSFTLEELAYYDGAEGRPAYVAINGIVYDVSNMIRWAGGTHFGVYAGNDVTEQFMSCHQGRTEVLNQLTMIGVLEE